MKNGRLIFTSLSLCLALFAENDTSISLDKNATPKGEGIWKQERDVSSVIHHVKRQELRLFYPIPKEMADTLPLCPEDVVFYQKGIVTETVHKTGCENDYRPENFKVVLVSSRPVFEHFRDGAEVIKTVCKMQNGQYEIQETTVVYRSERIGDSAAMCKSLIPPAPFFSKEGEPPSEPGGEFSERPDGYNDVKEEKE